jgi:hypothetical protein
VAESGCVPLPGAGCEFVEGAVHRDLALRARPPSSAGSPTGGTQIFTPTRDPSPGLMPESRTPLRSLVTQAKGVHHV